MTLMFQGVMRKLTDEEYNQLEKNILADGIREPLVMWGDVLIDGHNRYKIAQKHNLPYQTVQIDFEDPEAAARWIINNQDGRRNLSAVERLEIAERVVPDLEKQAKERQLAGKKYKDLIPDWGEGTKGTTGAKVAKIAGVGHSTYDRYKHVKKHGEADVKKKMESGEMSISAAYETTKKAKTYKKPDRPRNPRTGEILTEKVCSVCGRTLPVDKFYFSRGRYSGTCKQCQIAQKSYGISPTIREDIDAIQKATEFLTDTERVIEYSIEDVILPIVEEVSRLIRIIDTETRNHSDLLKDPANKDALVKALERGASQIQSKIKDLAR